MGLVGICPAQRITLGVVFCYTKNMKSHVTIIPALLESRLDGIVRKMFQVSTLTDMIQIDMCDGHFVPAVTYGGNANRRSIASIFRHAQKNVISLELDMMVDLDRSYVMTKWVGLIREYKPDRIIFHLGSTYRWDELFTALAVGGQLPCVCGLAVRLDHTSAEIRKVYDNHSFSFIQVMGIEQVGKSGQPFSNKTYAMVKKIRRMYDSIDIAVDGGVKLSNVEKLKESGATRLGVNSGIFKTRDIAQTMHDLKSV